MRLILAAFLAALTVVPVAQGHRGDIWYDSATNTAGYIEDKYAAVSTARCYPLPVQDRARYNADSYVRRNGVRVWDHFLCGVYNRRNQICFTVAHISGQRWSDFYLTSFRYRGCTPYQLR
jgi:hypothetical protein